MEKIKILFERAYETIKSDGVSVCLRKTKNYIINQWKKETNKSDLKPEKVFMDVLFINGCYLPHPARYRISHQREQLDAAGISNNEVFYDNITMEMVKHYRIFIFFRCVYTEKVGEFIELAHNYNKVVLFDIDDLVIDFKYTNTISYLNEMSEIERKEYDDGVERMKKTLRLCDGAITTTERLENELKNYVPEVFINRNTASELIQKYSLEACNYRDILPYKDIKECSNKKEKMLCQKAKKEKQIREKSGLRIGYFSGSITHNEDFEMILPVICRLMDEYTDLELYLVGELDCPEELKKFENRIKQSHFIPWNKLPKLISEVDINLVPLKQSIFNEAKSENKWIEASLVKVPTVASKVGALEKMIQDKKTGLLCNTLDEWYFNIKQLLDNTKLRNDIAINAYDYVKQNCTTLSQAYNLAYFIKGKMNENFAFIFSALEITGGILVALKHCSILKKFGKDVFIINQSVEERNLIQDNHEIPVLSEKVTKIIGNIDNGIATLWSTTWIFEKYLNIQKKFYLVQNYEVDFYKNGEKGRLEVNSTYFLNNVIYLTISKWCKEWLNIQYKQNVRFIENGIDEELFSYKERKFEGKIRILIEGNSSDYNKNVDESFRIVEALDKNKFEIWYLSYLGKVKDWYYVDKAFYKLLPKEVVNIYHNCHILIKSSILESFSYPPLEMMATGGYVVAVPNNGNIEYLKDEENCLFYEKGNIKSAVLAIERICNDLHLREKLNINGRKTVERRKWNLIEEKIVNFYH